MNKSVELLLQRMKDHPEEFLSPRATSVSSYSMNDCRFGFIVSQIIKRKFPDGATTINGLIIKHLEFLPDEEIDALYAGLLGICEENFYSNIVDELANNNWDKDRALREQANWYVQQPVTKYNPAQTQPLMNPAQNSLRSNGTGQGFLSNLFNSGSGL